MKTHDPEASAARYLGTAMGRRTRRRFEAHLLECPECWEEVRLGALGRGFAEAGRELAPAALRDRIRGEVSLMPARRGGRLRLAGMVVAALVVIGASVAAVTMAVSGQPEAIDALVADFRGAPVLDRDAEADLPARLGDLSLVEVAAGGVDDLAVVAHRYRDAAGHRVSVYRTDETVPMARGARPQAPGTWSANVDGTVLLCSERPFPALVVGDDVREVTLAARLLGLT